MPTVFRYLGFLFFFHANEGIPREPIHIHVEDGEREAKFWMQPAVLLAYNDGYSVRALRQLYERVETNRDRIERAWYDFFGN